jgi:hypothetical protein
MPLFPAENFIGYASFDCVLHHFHPLCGAAYGSMTNFSEKR